VPIEKTALLPVSPDVAFALITEPERLRRWQTVSARVDLRAGGEFRWTVTPGHIARGTFREVVPGKRLVFGFGWEQQADMGPDASVITVTIEPQADGTLVRLVHDGLTDEQATGHNVGWTHYFERLELAATTGDAGPDEWAAAPAELNPLTSADACLAVLQHVLLGTTSADLGRATPCSEFDVAQLADHLAGSMIGLGGAAGVTVIDPGGDLEPRFATMAQQAIEAWHERGLEGTMEGPVPTAELVANVLSIELLIHAWDFATALGRKLVVSDELAGYVLQLTEATIQPALRDQVGFADPIEVRRDADPLVRLLAFTGRAA
jgi:uncharacterized protein (TIGR03086 family)